MAVCLCRYCGDPVPQRRAAVGYTLCMPCGERDAKSVRHCIVPMNKSNYVVVSDHTLLKQLNPKRVGG